MSSTSVAEIPRELLIGDGLKEELLAERTLKPTEAGERNTLPTAEDVKLEKEHQSFINGNSSTKITHATSTVTTGTSIGRQSQASGLSIVRQS